MTSGAALAPPYTVRQKLTNAGGGTAASRSAPLIQSINSARAEAACTRTGAGKITIAKKKIVPVEIRTRGLRLRRPTLYPAELPAQTFAIIYGMAPIRETASRLG